VHSRKQYFSNNLRRKNPAKSIDLGGYGIGPPRPTQQFGYCSSKKVLTSWWKWTRAPSCWN